MVAINERFGASQRCDELGGVWCDEGEGESTVNSQQERAKKRWPNIPSAGERETCHRETRDARVKRTVGRWAMIQTIAPGWHMPRGV